MLSLAFAAALAGIDPGACKLDVAPGETLIERRSLVAGNGRLEAASVATRDVDAPWSRVMVLGANCRVVFERRFEWSTDVHFSDGRLGEQPFLFVTAFRPGGSGCGYDHLILAYGGEMDADDGVQALAPALLHHSNMDGIFVGDLGGGRGPGLITWTAQWNSPGHYAPHQYKVVRYLWRNGRFEGPEVRMTTRSYDPSPETVATRLKLGVRDMTQQSRFGEC